MRTWHLGAKGHKPPTWGVKTRHLGSKRLETLPSGGGVRLGFAGTDKGEEQRMRYGSLVDALFSFKLSPVLAPPARNVESPRVPPIHSME